MSQHRFPRRGSLAFDALRILHGIGGVATASVWSAATGAIITGYQFTQRVTTVLVRHGLVTEGIAYTITNDGRMLLGEPVEVEPQPDPQIANPRTVPPFSPLQRRSTSAIVYREGAFDYRNSPSIMGGQRVSYRTQT